MNHVPQSLPLTHPAHQTAIYRQKGRGSEMTEQRRSSSETNIITEQRQERKHQDLRDERETKKELG